MYNKLVLSGGSVKGSMMIGMLKYFEENEIILEYLNEIVGTSIGSLIALLIVIGYKSDELRDIFYEMNFDEIKDVSLKHLETGYGFDDGEKMSHFIKCLMVKKEVGTETTFSELYHMTRIKFACSAYNVSKKVGVFFDHIKNPDMPVFLGIRSSMNIPLLFCPVLYKGDYYVDGGLTCNLPIRYIKENLKTTLSVAFEEINFTLKDTIDNIEEYLYNLMKSIFNQVEAQDKKFIVDNGYDLLTLKTKLSTSNSFFLTQEQKEELYMSGYNQTKEFFDKK